MYYNVRQNGQETKKTATTDSEKCNLFNDFSDVFTKDGKINKPPVCTKQKLNYLRISEEKIERKVLGLQANKACGPDNIGNIILKTPQLWQSLSNLSSKPALIKENTQRAGKQARSPRSTKKMTKQTSHSIDQ